MPEEKVWRVYKSLFVVGNFDDLADAKASAEGHNDWAPGTQWTEERRDLWRAEPFTIRFVNATLDRGVSVTDGISLDTKRRE